MNNIQEIIHDVSDSWGFDLINFQLLQHKGDRFVYEIETIESKFVVKISSRNKTKESLEKDLHVYTWLDGKDFLYIPRIIQNKNGVSFIENEERFVYVMEYISNKKPLASDVAWSQIGDITAKLHNLQNYPYSSRFSLIPKLTWIKDQFEQSDFLFNLTHRIINKLDTTNFFKALIHTDIGLHNILTRDDTFVFIDWDDAGLGYRIFDIAYPLCAYLLNKNNNLNKDNARSFYLAYNKKVIRKLSEDEISSLFEISVLFQIIYASYGNLNKNEKNIKEIINNEESIRKDLASIFSSKVE